MLHFKRTFAKVLKSEKTKPIRKLSRPPKTRKKSLTRRWGFRRTELSASYSESRGTGGLPPDLPRSAGRGKYCSVELQPGKSKKKPRIRRARKAGLLIQHAGFEI